MKISLCIVCMNRTLHLRETLPQNIKDNIDYPDLEIVLLDYGSKDDMAQWARNELSEDIASGRLRYCKNEEPQVFKISHAKNMAFRLATGDIICSVDADNYTGRGFADFVHNSFREQSGIFLTAPPVAPNRKWWDVQGRICLWKADFLAVNGYDEQIVDYGYEDLDFKKRLACLGRTRTKIQDCSYLDSIRHDDHLRVAEGSVNKRLREVFIGSKRDNTYEVIGLYKDDQYERFCIKLDQAPVTEHLQGIGFPDFAGIKYLRQGCYENKDGHIRLLNPSNAPLFHLQRAGDGMLMSDDKRTFRQISTGDLLDKILMERAMHVGRKKTIRNKLDPHPINPDGYGKGTVWINFTDQRIDLE